MSEGVEVGRVDQLLIALGEHLCRQVVEPRFGGVPLWDAGVGAVVKAAIAESSTIPKHPITAVELARMAGLLGPGPGADPGLGCRAHNRRRADVFRRVGAEVQHVR